MEYPRRDCRSRYGFLYTAASGVPGALQFVEDLWTIERGGEASSDRQHGRPVVIMSRLIYLSTCKEILRSSISAAVLACSKTSVCRLICTGTSNSGIGLP
jgi:hypothetical protein